MTLNKSRTAVTAAFITNGFVVGSFFARVPDFKQKFDVSTGQFSVALFLDALGVLLSIGIAGKLSAKYGSRTVAIPATYLLSLSLFLTGLTSNFIQFCIALFFVGGLLALQDVPMNTHAIAIEHKFEKKLMSTFHAMFSLGGFAGAFTGGLFSQAKISPAVHTLIVGTLTTLAAFLLRNWWLPASIDIHEIERHEKRKRRPGIFWILGIIALCASVGEGAAGDWGGILTRETFGASPFMSALPYVLFSTTMVIGRLLGDRIRARFGGRQLLITGGVISGFGLASGLLIGGNIAVIAGWAFLGSGLGFVIPVAFSKAGEIAKDKYSKEIAPSEGVALVGGIGYSGFMAGPPTIGFLANIIDLRWAMMLPAILALLMAFLASRALD